VAVRSFKLAVSFYLKAMAIAEELSQHDLGERRGLFAASHAHSRAVVADNALEIVKNNVDQCMRAADECFVKSQVTDPSRAAADPPFRLTAV
jgi:hypothetical protein